jgi:preprotein translocase subunit SecD
MFIPFVNLINIPAQIIAFILGILGLKSSKRSMATTGIILSCVAFFMSIVISAVSINMFGSILNKAKNIDNDLQTKGGISAELYQDDLDVSKIQLEATKSVISKRLDSYNITRKVIQTDVNNGTIKIIFARNDEGSDIKNTVILDRVTATNYLSFQEVDEDKKDSSGFYLPTGKIIVTGSDILDASVVTDPQSGAPVISLKFNTSGSKKFAEATGRLIGKPIAIFMDNNLIVAPTVSAQITNGEAIITGQKNAEEASALAANIRSGSLPLSFKIKNIKTYPSKR